MEMVEEAATKAWRWVQSVLGGSISRGNFAAKSAAHLAILTLLAIPAATFIQASTPVLQVIYAVFSVPIAVACVSGLFLDFDKRLRDQAMPPFLSLALIVGVPFALVSLAYRYGQLRQRSDIMFPTGDLAGAALLMACLICIGIGLGPSRPRNSELGDVGRAVAPPSNRFRFQFALGLTAFSGVIAAAIYAGYVDPSLWVGRSPSLAYSPPALVSPDGSVVIASCGNVRGVSARADYPNRAALFPNERFERDQVSGSWNVLYRPDGTLDILVSGPRQLVSYRQDGFNITSRGLVFGPVGAPPTSGQAFQIIATSGIEGQGVTNVTSMNFIRRQSASRVLISRATSSNQGSVFTVYGGYASGSLMVGDCIILIREAPVGAPLTPSVQ